MQVTVPAGIGPGDAFTIGTPDGQQMQVTCPPNSGAGQVLAISVPAAPVVVTATVVPIVN